ncbi:MAG: glycosyltransferase [Calditrichaeota bacterium]|nr:MAG: glycosyltransferase [Calditrichota bacterium]
MLYFFITFLSLLVLGYCAALLFLRKGFAILQQTIKSELPFFGSKNLPTVTVIVAARNEEHNLPVLLHHLSTLDYPREKLEICIVNDRSTDGTAEILDAASNDVPALKAIHIKDLLHEFAPKKRALDMAIRATKGEIIMLTDADCTPPPTWIKATLACYKKDTAGVIGYSPYRFDKPLPRLLEKMLALEFFSIAAVAAATAGLGKPATAAGCNLSYRRKTYLQAKGFEGIQHWVSGDDDLFILKVGEKNIGRFSYGLNPKAFVPAAAPATWSSFWNQRIRYASKGAHYAWPLVTALVAIYFFNFMLTICLPLIFLGFTKTGIAALAAWILKSIFEWIFLRKAATAYQESDLLKYFIPTAFLHPFYIVLFGFLGTFSRFDWRGDQFSVTAEELTHG